MKRGAHHVQACIAGGIFVVTVFAGVLVVRAGPEHDVNVDGTVDLTDVLDVLAHFGEAQPTPAPTLTVQGSRAVIPGRLIDTSTGATVALFPTGRNEMRWFSCDGTRGVMENYSGGQYVLQAIETTAGDVLMTSSTYGTGSGVGAIIPCPFNPFQQRFPSGVVLSNRAVVWHSCVPYGSSTACLELWDLESGTVLYSTLADINPPGPRLNCAQDVLLYREPGSAHTRLLRLQDGTPAATLEYTSSVSVTC